MAATVKSALDRHISIVKSTWSKEVSDLKVAGSLLKDLKPVQAGLHAVGATVKNITDGLRSHLEVVRGRI
ncbi:MAG: hypothetical protein QXI11_00950 [Thermoproteota archaeon]